jgi:hypothetical protein
VPESFSLSFYLLMMYVWAGSTKRCDRQIPPDSFGTKAFRASRCGGMVCPISLVVHFVGCVQLALFILLVLF